MNSKVAGPLPNDGAAWFCGHRACRPNMVGVVPAVALLTADAADTFNLWERNALLGGRAVCQEHLRWAEMYVDETETE